MRLHLHHWRLALAAALLPWRCASCGACFQTDAPPTQATVGLDCPSPTLLDCSSRWPVHLQVCGSTGRQIGIVSISCSTVGRLHRSRRTSLRLPPEALLGSSPAAASCFTASSAGSALTLGWLSVGASAATCTQRPMSKAALLLSLFG